LRSGCALPIKRDLLGVLPTDRISDRLWEPPSTGSRNVV
jgi:hypothetical protein